MTNATQKVMMSGMGGNQQQHFDARKTNEFFRMQVDHMPQNNNIMFMGSQTPVNMMSDTLQGMPRSLNTSLAIHTMQHDD
jgi:hypothetical protein